MGSFYSSCSISHMRLYNQKTSIQLLVPNYTDIHEHKSMIVSNDGAQTFYSPFGFPINGVYDDYGNLSDIVEDKNTKMLEEFFNMSIYEIIDCIGRKGDIPDKAENIDIYENLAMTYFRTEVLMYLQDGWDKINLESPNKYSQDESISIFLKSMDFNKKDLNSYLDNYDNLSDDDRTLLRKMIIGSENKGYISSYKYNMFKLLPIDSSFKDDILKQFKFIMKLGYSLGRTLIPSDYGSQDVNFLETFRLNEFVNDLLIDDMKNYYCSYDDEYKEVKSIIKGYDRNNKLKSIGI